jgi:transposase InsO family protein
MGGGKVRRQYRRYDPRLKNIVAESGDIERFASHGIPRSTLREWVRNGPQEFITLPELEFKSTDLILEVTDLKSRLAIAIATNELVTSSVKIFGFQVQFTRLPSATTKAEIIAVIRMAATVLPLQACLASIGLSAARFHHWVKREVKCLLTDVKSCPQISPTKMTAAEVSKITDMVTNRDLAHYSVTALSWLGKKTGEIVASASTWSRIIREHGLKRNTARIYPPKPKLGIRASAPGQIWHLDMSIIRLQNGTKVYIQAIIDNYSRYVLSWKVSLDYGGLRTKELIEEAIGKARSLGLSIIPDVFVDSGVENLNSHVDEMILSGLIRRFVAQIDIEFSNSMIEMLFHRLKHRHLFNILLDSFQAVVDGVFFYLTESNDNMPHSALKGATPREAITGKWDESKIAQLREQIITAKQVRADTNRSRRCHPCQA